MYQLSKPNCTLKKILAFSVLFLALAFCAQAQQAQSPRERETAVKVFPNPATNVVNILGLINSQKAHITISDMYGNLALEHRWEIRDNSLSIPIASLNPGIYVVSIVSEGERVQTKFYKK
ncbi:T9SS type A sorting domain-containing protein [Flavobacteriaceae bacterium 3-367]|uniref:T9SS type A sorting domain-containing protein n=1 Tax=Eudoraea algarum TaxID=3417568 RepID=UPI003271A596